MFGKKLKFLLDKELEEEGFLVRKELPADYGLFFNIKEDSYTNTNTYTSYVPQTSYSNVYANGKIVTVSPTTNKAVEKTSTSRVTYKKIKYDLVNAKKNKYGKREREWSGFSSTDINDFDSNPRGVVRNIVKLIGKEFKGDIAVSYEEE